MPNPRRNGGPDEPPDLTNDGISDTELLAIVDDLADENGWTHTTDVRMQLGEHPEEAEQKRRSGVGPRLSWMRRYGWLEQKPDERSAWRLTAMGHAVLDGGDLSKAMQSQLEKMNPAQRVRLTREISRTGAGSPDEIKNALRREWQRNLLRRR